MGMGVGQWRNRLGGAGGRGQSGEIFAGLPGQRGKEKWKTEKKRRKIVKGKVENLKRKEVNIRKMRRGLFCFLFVLFFPFNF